MTGTEQAFLWMLSVALLATIFNEARKQYNNPARRRR